MRCAGLRRALNPKILFPPCLYIVMTSYFTWGSKIQDLVPPLVTYIATLLWIALLALSVSIDLVSPSARVTSVKFQKGVGHS